GLGADDVGNLEPRRRRADDRAHPRPLIELRRRVAKEASLPGIVVDRVIARQWVLNTNVVRGVASGEVVLGLARGAAIFDVGRAPLLAAAIEADGPGVVERGIAGLDVDEACGVEAVLRRQRTGDQLKAADEAGVEDLAKTRNAVRDLDAVDAVLHVGVLVAHV